jgi:prophage antirepressor-like protein
MNNLKMFNYSGLLVRVVLVGNEPWWVLRDVCDVLGISNSRDVSARLDDDEKGVDLIDTLGGTQQTTIINESGLYSVILRSDRPEAKAFRKWVTSEILPQIRKTGSYSPVPTDPIEQVLMLAEKLTITAKQVIEERNKNAALAHVIEEQRPKVELAEQCINAVNALSMAEAAKVLGTGRTRLFAHLKASGVLMRSNNPYQEFVDRGLFVVKAHPVKMGDICINYPQTYVTGKGIDFIRKSLNISTSKELAV